MPNEKGNILAIDPGPLKCGVVLWDPEAKRVVMSSKDMSTEQVIHMIDHRSYNWRVIGVEMIQGYGMQVGDSVFETCVTVGIILKASGGMALKVYRKDVKSYICGNTRAGDSAVREALIAIYGEPGKKATPGTLYGIAQHAWPAMAIAHYLMEKNLMPPIRKRVEVSLFE